MPEFTAMRVAGRYTIVMRVRVLKLIVSLRLCLANRNMSLFSVCVAVAIFLRATILDSRALLLRPNSSAI